MRILHYFVGFPPYRSGGMTKFAVDLMNSQFNDGNDIYAIWPGKISIFPIFNKLRIKKRKPFNHINNFEIINPLPIPLDEGINIPENFVSVGDENVYREFLKKIKPDVIHIHTLMGLHEAFVTSANNLKIKTIFTTHDYFGICPKVTLFNNNTVCSDNSNCKRCVKCNQNALSLNKIIIMQHPFYRLMKNSILMKKLRSMHRQKFFENEQLDKIEYRLNNLDYVRLRDHYIGILKKIDIIHFNSNLTKSIYLKYFLPKRFKVITLSHKDIIDNRNNHHIDDKVIRFTYLASSKPYKGLYFLIDCLDELYRNKKYKFILNVYTDFDQKYMREYIRVPKKSFLQSELKDIFSKTDMMLAPSIWYETFGFTVLEALSNAVPVFVTENVGAKDVVYNGGIISEVNKNKFIKYLSQLNHKKLKQYTNAIKSKDFEIKTWDSFRNQIYDLYKK